MFLPGFWTSPNSSAWYSRPSLICHQLFLSDLDFRHFSKYKPCASLTELLTVQPPPCLCFCWSFLAESPLLSSELPLPICLPFRSLYTNPTGHILIWTTQTLTGFQQKGQEGPPNLEVSLTSESYTSDTHSGWHRLSVETMHPKEASRSRELKRYENTLLGEDIQGLLYRHNCTYISGTRRWANKGLIKSVTGNRGSNQTIINCDNWPRQWPNQLQPALACASIACCCWWREPSRQTCTGCCLRRPEETLWIFWVGGILTFRIRGGWVMRGLEIIYSGFSDLVCFPKSPLLSFVRITIPPSNNLRTNLAFFCITRKEYSGQ